ncbi:hypothetical protein HGK72_29465 [Mycolicibacterium fortuitum]|uniref:hypothetical protein n=1 Tax=Mycolicibacterium fortuitum TaxID=1766 RepID=UPI00148FE458|nr:hypothetical protein [Mycolicibacterium fortuitum]
MNEVVWVEVEREALEECAVVVCPGPSEEVATISNFRGFTADLYMKNEQPADLDPSAPDACKIVFDQTVVFGAELKDFRSVVYGGKTADYVKSVNQITQSVGVYPADAAAQIYFDRLNPIWLNVLRHIKKTTISRSPDRIRQQYSWTLNTGRRRTASNQR